MSHKYYGFQKQEENDFYTIPFLSAKAKRLRFLNGDFLVYGEKNEFIFHKNPGLTILRLTDSLINRLYDKQSTKQKLISEFLNQLLSNNLNTIKNDTNFRKQINVNKITINPNSSIQIILN